MVLKERKHGKVGENALRDLRGQSYLESEKLRVYFDKGNSTVQP